MRNFQVEEKLRKKLEKLIKKDKVAYDSIQSKFQEILTCSDVNHYKNLRNPLQNFKRVHIRTSFVLVFKYVESEDLVVFYDFDHHDNIYI